MLAKLYLVSLDIDMRKNGWLKFNINQTGYYRVNYPLDNWKNLAKTLIHNHQVIFNLLIKL